MLQYAILGYILYDMRRMMTGRKSSEVTEEDSKKKTPPSLTLPPDSPAPGSPARPASPAQSLDNTQAAVGMDDADGELM